MLSPGAIAAMQRVNGNPDPYWANVVFYLPMLAPGATPVDASPAARSITVGTGPSSGYVADAGLLPGMSAYQVNYAESTSNSAGFTIPPNGALDLGTGDFTIECWFFVRTVYPASGISIMAIADASANIHALTSYTTSAFWPPGFFYRTVGGSGWSGMPSPTPGKSMGAGFRMGQWHHCAIERTGTTMRLYEDGQPVPFTGVWSGNLTGNLYFGRNWGLGGYGDFMGLIGGARVTKGVARWQGAPFVPSVNSEGWMVDTSPDFSGTAHKYWRVYATAHNGAAPMLREVEMRATSGGASLNTTLAAVPVLDASSNTGQITRIQDNWFDTSAWNASSGLPAWASVDLLEPMPIRHFRVHAGGNNAPKDFAFQYSDDKISWTTALGVSGASWTTASESKAWHGPDVGAHRYWRLYATAVQSGTTLGLQNLGLALSAFTRDMAENSRRYGSETDQNYGTPQQDYFDGAKLTSSNFVRTEFFPGYYGQRLISATEMNELMLMASTTTNATPSAGTVQSSNDGQRWQDEWPFSGLTSWTSNEQKVVTRP